MQKRMNLPIAGPKLRQIAIERTTRHIDQESCSGSTILRRILTTRCDQYSSKEYLDDERRRLARLQGL